MNQATCCGWNKQGMPRCTREYGRGLPCEIFCWSVTLTLLLIVCIYSWYMQVHQRIFWYHSVAGVWLDYPPLTTCNNTPAHGTTDLKPKRLFPFFLQNPVLQTGRWSWLLAPSDVALPLRLRPTRPLPLLSLVHLLLHHCECFLERVTGGELVNLKIEAVVTESELSWL